MSSEPTIEQSAGDVEGCESFHPGHNTHWIPVLKKYPKHPRAEAVVAHVEGKQFTVTSMGRTWTYYFHDPETLIAVIANRPKGFKHVLGTSYITSEIATGHAWFNLSAEPLKPCQGKQPKIRPYPFQKPEELF